MRKELRVFLWVLRIVAALIMLQTLFFKFTGSEESVYIFSTLGLEPWGRIGTGVFELIASILLLWPRTTAFGAALAIGLMSGALFFHITKLGIEVKADGGLLFIYALVVFVCCAILLFVYQDQIKKFLLKIFTTNTMKKNSFLLMLCILPCMTQLFAQSNIKKHTSWFDLTASVGQQQGTASIAYVYNRKLGKKEKFDAGLGLRFTSYFGKDKYFITAPAKLTSGKTGPSVFFIENIQENIDSIFVTSSQTNALNLSINFGYHITQKIYAGFNIDAVGFTFGKTVNSQFISSTSPSNSSFTASPTVFNALLVSDNDRGTLNSELFVLYRINKKVGVKAGFQFLFTEYTTNIDIQQKPEPNDRFRNKVSAFSFGITYQLN